MVAKVTVVFTMKEMSMSKLLLWSPYTSFFPNRTDEISMAIQHSLETTSIPFTPLQVQSYTVPTNSNPYILPWSMRGLLEEEFVKTQLNTEAVQLLEQFDAWKPTTKVLKDVKFRLEAIRSKL